MAHEGLWEQLDKLDPQTTAGRAKCRFESEQNQYVIELLNREYVVKLSDRQIFSVQEGSSSETAGFLEQLCILAYLINAQDLPLAGKLVKAESLPTGQFFFRGVHGLPTEKLQEAFGDCPEGLYKVVELLSARRCEFGDASIELYVLPRIPLTMAVWGRCEQFDSRASILFDQTAAEHLLLDALGAAVNLAVDAVITAFEQNN